MISPLNGSEAALETLLATPDPAAIDMMKRLPGDIIILGVGGKMGVSLAATAANACNEAGVEKRIVGVARTITDSLSSKLETLGVELLACDLSVYEQVAALPRLDNVLFLAGRKFGKSGSEPLTWLANTVIPANVAQVFQGRRMVVFSTGCVYEMVSPAAGGSKESDSPNPVGEYASSCLGRERVFEYYAEHAETPVLLYRLNYAMDLRYGVLVEIARDVYEGRPVNLQVGAFNVIWQGDAVNRALLCLEHASSPATALNITGHNVLRVEEVARRFGELLGKPVQFEGEDSGHAYLSDASRSFELFGPCGINEEQLMEMVADWVKCGGAGLDKPTHFSVTDGRFLDAPS